MPEDLIGPPTHWKGRMNTEIWFSRFRDWTHYCYEIQRSEYLMFYRKVWQNLIMKATRHKGPMVMVMMIMVMIMQINKLSG
jgi:hypothetical protein